MSELLEQAKEGLEHAHHAHVHEGESSARWVAVLIAVLAAALAIAELGEKAKQTEYLTRHIGVSDDYAYYQEKHVRQTMMQAEQALLQSLPNAADPAVQARVAAARQEAARLQDNPQGEAAAGGAGSMGMRQLAEKAQHEQHARDHAFHLSHQLELVVGGLQIAIVLASVSIVTRVRMLTWGGGGLGAAMVVYGLLVWLGGVG
ncbi:MAG: DUF4337 domain-containing protein [Pseudomonadota bacterium]|nr:DUF4337 domain-containing protein [Pseudomonadota bacterium]